MSRENGFDEWGGYMEAKISKLEEQFTAASNPYKQSNLFAGISIYVNGRTDPCADDLKRIMMTHGGTYHHYERAHTTYIVAENLPDVKVRQMQHAKKLIISAKWIVDCVHENRILDYTNYLLYTNQKNSQPRLGFPTIPLNSSKASTSIALPNTTSVAEVDLKVSLEAYRKKIIAKSENNANTCKTEATKTAKDEHFLSEFYNNSRLHHIATLGARFKKYVMELREQSSMNFTAARQKLKLQLERQVLISNVITNSVNDACIMHIDMDCFFVSVGLRNHADMRGKPVAVTHSCGGVTATEVPIKPGADRQAERELWVKRLQDNGRSAKVQGSFYANYSLSEIASCSYEARNCGVRNGMFVGQALQLCPNLQTIQYDFKGYKEVAQQLYDIIAQYTLDIEAISCDEMFVDLTQLLQELQTTAMQLVSILRQEVRQITGCPCSAGVGPNKLMARMATKRAKPDGQFEILASAAETYMAPMPIADLPGVGGSTAHALKQAGLQTCADVQEISLARIQMIVGKKSGETLHQFCRGIDKRALVYTQIRKSVSAEVNYGIRFQQPQELEEFLLRLCDEVHARLMEIKRRTKCVNLKLMVRAKDAPTETAKFLGHGVCDTFSKAVTLPEFTNSMMVIRNSVLNTMKTMNIPPTELRGIGIQLTKLDEPTIQSADAKNRIEQLFNRAVEKQKNQNTNNITKNRSNEIKQNNEEKNSINKQNDDKHATDHVSNKKSVVNHGQNVVSMLKDAVKRKQAIDIDVPQHKQDCQEFLKALPTQKQLQRLECDYAAIKKQAEKQQQEKTEVQSVDDNCCSTVECNIFIQSDLKKSIIDWINSSTLHSDSDVLLIMEHANELVQNKLHDQLYEQLIWLSRYISRYRGINACKWHATGIRILENVQQNLCALPDGLPFYISITLNCDKYQEHAENS